MASDKTPTLTGPRRFIQWRGHGPVFIDPPAAWCVACVWVGPDRAGDPHADLLTEDDACHHLHTVWEPFSGCGVCEHCRGGLPA